jgi:hypothetical protein
MILQSVSADNFNLSLHSGLGVPGMASHPLARPTEHRFPGSRHSIRWVIVPFSDLIMNYYNYWIQAQGP